jgi:hypothetical protein
MGRPKGATKISATTNHPADLADDLGPAKRRLMTTLCEPGSANLSVTELCEKAKVDRVTYYDLMRDQQLRDRVREARRMAFGNIQEQIDALKHVAKKKSFKAAADRRTLLQATGHLPVGSVNVALNNEVNTTVQNLMPLGQVLWCYQQANWPTDRWLPCVRDQFEAGVLHPELPPLPELKRLGCIPEVEEDQPLGLPSDEEEPPTMG